MNIIICGSRDFDDYALLEKKCNKLFGKIKNAVIFSGNAASGADRLGEKYAAMNGRSIRRFPADWLKHGKKAGILRNIRMLEQVGLNGAVIAFWDGKSRGTKHMILIARKAGMKVKVIQI